MSEDIRKMIDKVKGYTNERNNVNEGLFDVFKKKDNQITNTPSETPKQPQSFFDVFKSNLKDGNYGLPIMFSALDGGFVVNNKYGNPKTNYYCFDVRGNHEIMQLVNTEESFIKTINRNGKNYMVVGLMLDRNNEDVKEMSRNWITSGRFGYVFATVEHTDEIINYIKEKTSVSNIGEILLAEAVKSAKAFFTRVRDWNGAIKMPN